MIPAYAGRAGTPVACNPGERHDQRHRVTHEIEQVIEPAARICRRPTVKLGLHLRYPRERTHRATPWPRPRGAPPSSGASSGIAASFPSRNRCRPSPCTGLSPARSTTTAPPHLPVRRSVRLSRLVDWMPILREPRSGGSHVHHVSLVEVGARLCPSGLAMGTPQTFPMASRTVELNTAQEFPPQP